MTFNIILFPDFETLDVFGPVEIFGKIEKTEIKFYSSEGGTIKNRDGVRIDTRPIDQVRTEELDVLFIPGGMGARIKVGNKKFIDKIRTLAEQSRYVLTVCTGSALLAKTGLLDGKKATSNKRSFEWAKTSSDKVNWIKQARWTVDDKYYTSSGISAGMDMTLGFISDIKGDEYAREIAHRIEYNWQTNKDHDDFCNQ